MCEIKLDETNHSIPVFAIIENIKEYVHIKRGTKINDNGIAEELGITRVALASLKNRNSLHFLSYLAVWCIKNNIDMRTIMGTNIIM